MTRWRWLTVALCLWWFYRIDAASLVIVPDGGLTDARLCESLAAQYGYLVLPLESRDEYRPDGKRAGRWQIACFCGPESLRQPVAPR